MPVDHKEKAFESAIEYDLLTNRGWTKAQQAYFDQERALDPTQLFPFIKETQSETWDALEKLHGTNTETMLLDDLCKAMDSRGSLDVLRHGFKCYGKSVKIAYFKPAHGMNPETQQQYKANRLTITRQLLYTASSSKCLDVTLSLNGIPVATAELKNPLTGQTVENAKYQYKNDRSASELIFQFKKRTLVHFAVDPDEVYMTTRLNGKDTVFLPFNKGNGMGAGNPENPSGGYKTAYLWEEVWQRDSWLDILGRFINLEVTEREIAGKLIRKETVIFPRYHQLDAVRKLEAAARNEGAGNNYLVMHSAGSGKSNSIGWLTHRLANLHNANDEKIFDSIIVVTDRRVLDQQLQNTIYQFEHKMGVVVKIDEDSSQLAKALKDAVPIIVTTLQKFPFVTEKVGELPSRKYAVIVDEAHSSQSGEAAAELRGVLAGADIKAKAKEEAQEKGSTDYEEEIIKAMMRRGHQPNLSFFGFTATPKYKTLETFGHRNAAGKPEPFHVYSMRQAIEEGFILDVLKNYTTYQTYFRLVKKVEEDPKLDKRKAARALARFVSFHPYNLAQKTEVMIEHFRVHTRHRIGGKAKAMVVTGSREHAVRYKMEFDRYIAEKGYTDIKTLVAFSGTVTLDDPLGEFTEVGMNRGIREKELPERFAGDEYQVLIVADKYQTGFDQPLLHTMFVDKRLADVQAVQTLSRLNRTHPGKEDTFVLDFVNETEGIHEAFKPFYETPTVDQTAEPSQLYALQSKIGQQQVFSTNEVEEFCKVFFKPKAIQSPADHARLYALLEPAVKRFGEREPQQQEEFKSLLVAFRNLYSFLAQIIPFQDSDLEKLYTFVRFLLNKLPKRPNEKLLLDDEVQLKYYRLQKIAEGSIDLRAGDHGAVSAPTAVGTSASHEEKIELSQLIETMNTRFGTDFKPADELFLEQVRESAISDPAIQNAALVNTVENFRYVFEKAFDGLMIDRFEENGEMVAKILANAEMRELVMGRLLRQAYDQIRKQEADAAGAGSL
jgi:type I restriction enzyme R subunit